MNRNVMASWLWSLIGREPVEMPFFVSGMQSFEIPLAGHEFVTLVGPFKGLDMIGRVVGKAIKAINLDDRSITLAFEGGGSLAVLFAKEK